MINSDAFRDELREALNHLYDPQSLEQSRLVSRFGFADCPDPASAVRREIEQAIEVFRPADGMLGTEQRRGRRYQVLTSRYLGGDTQQAVANTLGISPRHLRREQERAISDLAEYLMLKFDLIDKDRPSKGKQQQVEISRSENAEINREMLWIAESLGEEVTDLPAVLRHALETARAIAKHGVSLDLVCDDELPSVTVPHVVLEQIVLNLLTPLIRNLSTGERLQIYGQRCDMWLLVTISVVVGARRQHILDALKAAADVSQRLLELYHGTIALAETGNSLTIRIRLPSAGEQVVVLAIEDNTDTIRLWQRYIDQTRFTLIKETQPVQALSTAIARQPDIIILDIMLGQVDGWEILRQLRLHRMTASIPVVVCTVLPQRDLALSLGASDFIQKPARGGEFRAALERQTEAVRLAERPR